LGVTRVVMEATSDSWKAPFYLLEAHGFEVWPVNARDVKHLPGRPKTDKLDAVWRCKVAERQLLRPSFVPPPAIRRLRDLTRYRADLVAVRTAENQRVEQAAGGRPDQALGGRLRQLRGLRPGHAGRADRRRTRPQGPGRAGPDAPTRQAGLLEEAFVGRFADQHGFLLETMLGRVDQASARAAPPPAMATRIWPGAGRGRRGRRADQHLPGRALLAHRPTPGAHWHITRSARQDSAASAWAHPGRPLIRQITSAPNHTLIVCLSGES
jgi:Transposase